MRVVFLDIDGVLNSENWLRQKSEAIDEPRGWFDPRAVALLNKLLVETGAKIVVSSAWRLCHEFEELKGILKSVGIETEVVGITYNLGNVPRGHEIADYLSRHPEIDNFVILDDDRDMDRVQHRLIKTAWKRGLQLSHVLKAVEWLTAESKVNV